MDPNHVACYAQAQVELRELFHELESNGQVSAAELQRSLVSFTAGDAKRDLLELLTELRRTKRQSLDEAEFLRVMWRKMYLASATDATKSGGTRLSKPINVSLAHVIVSVKRRQQLRQFASYYASRGISGADHLTSPPKEAVAGKGGGVSPKRSPVKPYLSPQQQAEQLNHQAADKDGALELIVALRRRHSPYYDVVACVFDPDALQMRSRTLLSQVRSPEIRNCSQLYCLLFTKDAGNFVLGCTYFGENVRRNHQSEKVEYAIATEAENDLLGGSSLYRSISWADRDEQGLLMLRMEEVGLRNIVAAASNRASFAASTGRKLHQWRALEPYRVPDTGNADEVKYLLPQGACADDTVNDEGGNQSNVNVGAGVRLLDTDPTGDCFGLLGGKPLVARTKTIADVGDIRQLAAGGHFYMAISSSGDLYSWESCPSAASSSSSNAPPLGRGCSTPEQVPWFSPPEKVFRVACGIHHALVLSSCGVYSWGSNIYGQLGLGCHCSPADWHTKEPAPVCLPTDCIPALDVACGDTHSVVLSVGGQIFTFGCNWDGQLGLDEFQINIKRTDVATTGCVYEPLRVNLPSDVGTIESNRAYLITAGPQTTAVVTTRGQVFQWGKCVPDGIDGVCGRVSRWVPEELKTVNAMNATSVPGPVWHSIAIADGLVVLTRHSAIR